MPLPSLQHSQPQFQSTALTFIWHFSRQQEPGRKGEHLKSLFQPCRYTANNVYKEPEAWIQHDEILNKISGSAPRG